MGRAQFTLALHKAWRGSKGQGLFMPEEQRGADRSIPNTERQHCSLTPKEQTCTGRSQRHHGCTTIWSRKSVGQLQAMAREVHVGREGPEQSRVQTLMWPGGVSETFLSKRLCKREVQVRLPSAWLFETHPAIHVQHLPSTAPLLPISPIP